MDQVERPAGDAIDVVIAWVDGRDRRHRAKRNRYLADPGGGEGEPEGDARSGRRFSDNDEIRFCLRSIRNYAPWVRTTWLVTDNQVPAAIDPRRAELDNIRIVDHREIFRGYEQLLPTFNSLAIETMLWRIEGLADRFVYLNDDMMLVGPVQPMDFFSSDGKVNLRGRWSNWKELPDKRNSFHGRNKLLGAEEFKPAFLANAQYRFRSREQFWPISAHDHLLLKSDRAQVVNPRNTAHFSKRYCLTASPDALEARLKQLTEGTMRMACINYLETVVDKVPNTMRYLSKATGPAAPFEKPPRGFWPAARRFRRSWIRRVHRILGRENHVRERSNTNASRRGAGRQEIGRQLD